MSRVPVRSDVYVCVCMYVCAYRANWTQLFLDSFFRPMHVRKDLLMGFLLGEWGSFFLRGVKSFGILICFGSV